MSLRRKSAVWIDQALVIGHRTPVSCPHHRVPAAALSHQVLSTRTKRLVDLESRDSAVHRDNMISAPPLPLSCRGSELLVGRNG